MKKKVKITERIEKLLTDNEYMTAEDIAIVTRKSLGSVYRSIRILRENGVGILVTKNGYILSEYASKQDDVNYLRRINGRRTSDIISLAAAEKDIRKRWNSIKDRKTLSIIFDSLHIGTIGANVLSLKKGMDQIKIIEKKKGVEKVK